MLAGLQRFIPSCAQAGGRWSPVCFPFCVKLPTQSSLSSASSAFSEEGGLSSATSEPCSGPACQPSSADGFLFSASQLSQLLLCLVFAAAPYVGRAVSMLRSYGHVSQKARAPGPASRSVSFEKKSSRAISVRRDKRRSSADIGCVDSLEPIADMQPFLFGDSSARLSGHSVLPRSRYLPAAMVLPSAPDIPLSEYFVSCVYAVERLYFSAPAKSVMNALLLLKEEGSRSSPAVRTVSVWDDTGSQRRSVLLAVFNIFQDIVSLPLQPTLADRKQGTQQLHRRLDPAIVESFSAWFLQAIYSVEDGSHS